METLIVIFYRSIHWQCCVFNKITIVKKVFHEYFQKQAKVKIMRIQPFAASELLMG